MKHWKTLFAVMLCVLALAVAASAQTTTGAITGTVTDPSGASVPNAKVTATHQGTNLSTDAQTTDAGIYNLRFLPIGSYTVSVTVKGFKKATLGPFTLEVNQVARVDVKLEVGDTTQVVEVKDIAPILQTESTATGDALSSTKLTSVPLNGRNFASMTLLIPGAVSTSPNAMNTSGRYQGSGSRPQVNGNREQTNNFLLDGVDVNDSMDNRIGYQPNVDALEEVKVITGNSGAEYGNAGGAVVNMALKSGTNKYKGNVFEFLRNQVLDANGFFRNRAASTASGPQPFRRNIFGGTFGGPIVKDKAFFFVDYEGTEQRASGPSTASVAPAAWRTGDLSQFLTLATPSIVRDPATGATLTARTPFPGNIIPQARITNPVAKKLFGDQTLYPLANQAGSGSLGVTSNYAGSSASKLRNHQADVKVDYRLSDKDNFVARWSIGSYEAPSSAAALPTTMVGGTEGPQQTAVLTWNRTFSPTVVNEVRLGFSRLLINDMTYDWSGKLGSGGNAAFGIPGGQPIPGLSSVSVGESLTAVGSGASIGNTTDNKFQYFDNLTYMKGRHLIKMGFSAIRYQQNRYYAGNNGALGLFTYSTTYSGLTIGDFLTDSLYQKGRGVVTGMWGHRQWRDGIFFNDDWKVLPNLTLNLGLRWEYDQPIYEVADRQVNIDTFTGKLLYAGQNGNSRALYESYKKQYQPRLGIAWTPEGLHNKVVIRAGWAFTSFMEGTGANLRMTMNPPYALESTITYETATPGTITTGFSDLTYSGTLDNPKATVGSFTGRAWDQQLKPQFTQQYNLTVETQLSNTWSMSTAYVGQKGTHLVVPHEANQALPGTGAYNTWAATNLRRPLYSTLPALGNVALTEGSARSSYNALQVSSRKRLSAGLEMMASYTFSKTIMDNLGYYGCGSVSSDSAYWQNAYDRRANRGPACFDTPHNFTMGGLYNLPFGKGQKFGSSMNRATDLILGGWNVNYFVSAHAGFPVTITAANYTGQDTRGATRANFYRKLLVKGTRSIDYYWGDQVSTEICTTPGVDNGTCAYGQPAYGSFGSAGVGTERMGSFFNMDASIGKKFNVTERYTLDFRVETFNSLNHVSWAPPSRGANSPSTLGAITSQIQNARNIQMGLKLYF